MLACKLETLSIRHWLCPSIGSDKYRVLPMLVNVCIKDTTDIQTSMENDLVNKKVVSQTIFQQMNGKMNG